MEQSLISIIMPVHNASLYIAEAIQSVQNQTYTNWELLIIDDFSTDTSMEIVEQFQKNDSRIISIKNTKTKGLAGALNTGLEQAKGSFIARMDADDRSVPERLSLQKKFLDDHPSIAVVGSWYTTFGNNKKPLLRKHPIKSSELAWKYISNTYLCHPTVFFRKKIITEIGNYPNVASEDFAFFSNIVHYYPIANIAISLLDYREHQTNYSTTKNEAITLSVYDTYIKNYIFYIGNTSNSDLFFQFHAKHILQIKDLPTILSSSYTIAKKIALPSIYIVIIKDILFAIAYTNYTHLRYIVSTILKRKSLLGKKLITLKNNHLSNVLQKAKKN